MRAAVLLGLASLLGRAVLLPILPPPKPAIQDEFSYLLAADTFASGRLTNPTHPLWVHFETVHVLSKPSYASKYPPLAGLLMALGQRVLGQPWFGVWLSMGVFCAVLYWALAGWLPPFWALLGGVLGLAQIGVVSYWTDSYWGGTPAAIGGALVLGAAGHLLRRPRTGAAIALALGLGVLANSRPYEGAVVACVCLTALVLHYWRRFSLRIARVVLLPMAAVLLPVVLWMLYYNYRVTGDALVMPYRAHHPQYAIWGHFIWQQQPWPQPHYNHEALRAVWVDWEGTNKRFEQDNMLAVHIRDFFSVGYFYLGVPLFAVVLLGLRGMLKQRKARVVLLLFGGFYLGLAVESTLFPHYAAPGTALAFLVAVCALRVIRHWRVRGRPIGGALATMALALFLLQAGSKLLTPANRSLFDKHSFIARRERVLEFLERQPGEHLVFVRYGKGHDVNHEWVFNAADIDRARVVWAHTMTPEKDANLLDYFSNRRAWLLEENTEVRLSRYVGRTPSSAAGTLAGMHAP